MSPVNLVSISKAQNLFLIDGIGAIASTFFLGVVLIQLEYLFGMPSWPLYLLAGIALVFACFSLACYTFPPERWRLFLKIITIANLTYCCLTIGFVVFHYSSLTQLGLAYFLVELIIIFILVVIEFRAANKKAPQTWEARY